MASTILVLLILLSFAFYVMNPEERTRAVRAVLGAMWQVRDAATQGPPKLERFHEALRARTRWALVTPALVAVNATIFVFMLLGAGAPADPETLVGWGGNFGPRTTNGEWWRLVTSMFVHSGMLHFVATVAGLIPLGLVVERLVGHLAFVAVYIAAGVLASLVSLSESPVTVSAGASGGIFGIYGLLLASLIWSIFQRSSVTIPLMALKKLGPPAAVFILYNMATDGVGSAAEIAGLATGFVCGLVLSIGVGDRKAPARRVATALAATGVIVVVSVVSLRGVIDVRPEIERVVAVEDRTAGPYQTAVDRFRTGRITAEALAGLIERTIVPELQAARAHLEALDGVPHEHQPLVASAEEYLRLREESWRLRAEGLHKSSMLTLRKADRTERASLEALERIRPVTRRSG